MYTKYFQSFFHVRLGHFMPESATFTPFSVPIPAISYFVVLGLSPGIREILRKIFKLSKTKILSIKKKVVSSA